MNEREVKYAGQLPVIRFEAEAVVAKFLRQSLKA